VSAAPPDDTARDAPPPDAPTVLVFHAHPDDEAIFTGGTIRLLTEQGWRVVLVVATRGEAGEASRTSSPDLGAHREDETRAAAAVLGVADVAFLGYADSGLPATGDPAATERTDAALVFADAPVEEAAERLARLARAHSATALVAYDEHGIYGHPDHVQVHRVGHAAAVRAGVPTVYEATVDREYLHFVETHLVEQAHGAIRLQIGPLDDADTPYAPQLDPAGQGLGLAATHLGLPSVLIDCTVDVRRVLADKRAAMLAHTSQIPADSPLVDIDEATFAEVYGIEWFRRVGPPTALDDLSLAPPW
jgi:LmbE family N-acetylglucosaminyl deacetylase